MIALQLTGLAFLIAGVWVMGSRFIASYINRGIEETDSSSDWSNQSWREAFLVCVWPIALPLAAPFLIGNQLGRKLWVKQHMPDLVLEELTSEELHDKDEWNKGYNAGLLQGALQTTGTPNVVIPPTTATISLVDGAGNTLMNSQLPINGMLTHHTLTKALNGVQHVEVAVS